MKIKFCCKTLKIQLVEKILDQKLEKNYKNCIETTAYLEKVSTPKNCSSEKL